MGFYVPPNSSQPHARNERNELSRRHDSINNMLESYHYSPALTRVLLERQWMLSMGAAPIEGEYVFQRVVHEENKRLGERELLLKYHLEHRVSEADVVLRILNLAAAAELERVKQCGNCFKWFYAERSHQRFCPGGQCRIAKYSKSPKYKEYRRRYMRRHRAKEAAKLAQLAKRKGG